MRPIRHKVMYRRYDDLRSKLGEPQWHDEQGVPRYCAFHPSECGIYDRYVALLEVACQCCERRFLVSASWNQPGNPELPAATNEGGSFDFGDAPWHGDNQCAGTTMTTTTTRVVEFWTRDGGPSAFEWRRRPEYEFVY